MPRRSFLLRHTRAQAPDEEAASKYLRVWEAKNLYFDIGAFPRISSEELFGNNLPMELEIGCGTGEFICSLAARHASTNFLGIEINLKSVYVAIKAAISMGLHNVRFIKAPVQYVYPLLVPNSLQAIYLHFPDPFYRHRNRKWRVLNAAFMGHAHTALTPGGRLSVVTDYEELFMDMLPLIESDPHFEKTHHERYLLGFEPEVKSRYQLYWEQQNLPIYRFEVRKVVSGEKAEGSKQ